MLLRKGEESLKPPRGRVLHKLTLMKLRRAARTFV